MDINLSDSDLQAIQRDEGLREQFLEQLIHEYSQSVLWISYTYVKEQQLAEEVMQDVFLTCFHKIGSFQNRSSIKTWIYRVTVNKCKDQLRKKTIKRFLAKSEQGLEDYGVNELYPESIMLEKAKNKLLTDRVMSLPVKLKEVILMFYFNEMQVKEIAEIVNIKENTVKSRLSRGRLRLKKMYKEEGSNEH